MDEGVKFKELYYRGLKYKEIAKEIRISVSKAKKLSRRLGLPKRYSKTNPYRKKQVETMVELYKGGNSTLMISNKLNLNPETIRRTLIREGIKRRNTNGLPEKRIKKQNKIICDMYIAGKPITNICEFADISKRAIFKRLKTMGINRNRNPHNIIGDHYDLKIGESYKAGESINKISEIFRLSKSFVTYRLNLIFPEGTEYKLFYLSKLTNKWKKMTKVTSRKELDKQRKRLSMRLGYGPQVKIKIYTFGVRQ